MRGMGPVHGSSDGPGGRIGIRGLLQSRRVRSLSPGSVIRTASTEICQDRPDYLGHPIKQRHPRLAWQYPIRQLAPASMPEESPKEGP